MSARRAKAAIMAFTNSTRFGNVRQREQRSEEEHAARDKKNFAKPKNSNHCENRGDRGKQDRIGNEG